LLRERPLKPAGVVASNAVLGKRDGLEIKQFSASAGGDRR